MRVLPPTPCWLLVFVCVGATGAAAEPADVDVGATVEAYTAAWNEPDEGKRRQLLERAWAADGVYSDPTAHVEGREALVAHIAGFHQQMPGASLDFTTGIDVHHRTLRFGWKLMAADGQTTVEGMDFGELGEDGRLVRIVGFFGPFPARD